jgi:hypothetical protein
LLVILTPMVVPEFTRFAGAPRARLICVAAEALGPSPFGASVRSRARMTGRTLTMLRRRFLTFTVILTSAVIRALA